jgi:pilus assembly protein FimV
MEAGASAGASEEGAGAAGAALRQELALTKESAEAQRNENEALNSRVSELETQLAKMQQLLTLKDEQLGAMQERLADTPEEAGATAPGETAVTGPEGEIPAAAAPPDAESPEVVAQAPIPPPVFEPAPQSEPVAEQAPETGLFSNPAMLGILGVGAVLLAALLWMIARRKQMSSPAFQQSIMAQPRPAPATPAAAPAHDDYEEDFQADIAADRDDFLEPSPDADPIAEADIYLAYGRYQQAEDLINQAIRTEDRDELRLKLLEIYFASHNSAAFETEAEALYDITGGKGPIWDRAVSMGRELCPYNTLFSAGFSADEDATVVAPRRDAPATGRDLDLDITGTAHTPAQTGLDFDSMMDSAGPLSGTPERNEEVDTKLDLARAYIDMGDPEGARSILDEVLEEGNDGQIQEAKDLLRHIS